MKKSIEILSSAYFFAIVLLTVNSSSKADFEGCDNTYSLDADSAILLRSPRWPNRYPSQTSCRYTFVAPVGYQIVYVCNIDLDQGLYDCSSELFYISPSGDKELRDSNKYCGNGKVSQSSNFRILVLAYKSGRYSKTSGKFECNLTARRKACDCGWYKTSRIVGGRETSITEFPSTAILLSHGEQFCGGTIVSSRYIVTAAHCVNQQQNASALTALVGVDNLLDPHSSPYAAPYAIEEIFVHENYDSARAVNDIAMLQTKIVIEYSLGVSPACIPFSRPNDAFTYNEVQIVGIGTTSFGGPKSKLLLSAAVVITTDEVCKNSYPKSTPTQFCSFWYGRDSCQFDSGGPAYLRLERIYLLGIISSGKSCTDSPGLNTRFTSFISWTYDFVGPDACYRPM